jgi:hypothetical protein
VIVLNVHAPTEDNDNDIKDSFCEELEQVFDQFPRYYLKNFVRRCQYKVREEIVFKLIIGNSLHEVNNDNRVRIVNSATSKLCQEHNIPCHDIHEYTWISADGVTHNQIIS